MTDNRISIPALRERVTEKFSPYRRSAGRDEVLALVKAVEAAHRYRWSIGGNPKADLDAALARFDFEEGT